MNKEDFAGVNTKKAKDMMAARKQMQEDHIEKTFGAQREELERVANGGANFALLNFVLTVHSLKHLNPNDTMENVNFMYKLMMVHVHKLERNAQVMADALGSENLKRLDIDAAKLIPSEYCAEGLQLIADEARKRAKDNKYIKTDKPKIIL